MTTEDDFDGNRANDNLMNGEFITKLEDENTLRWIEYAESNTNIDVGFSYIAYHYEIVLRRVGTNGGNTNNNNTTPNPPTPNTNNNNSKNTTPNTNTNIPPQISGTWRVTSGSGTATQTVSGRSFIGHLTYTPEIRTEIGLEITQMAIFYPV